MMDHAGRVGRREEEQLDGGALKDPNLYEGPTSRALQMVHCKRRSCDPHLAFLSLLTGHVSSQRQCSSFNCKFSEGEHKNLTNSQL